MPHSYGIWPSSTTDDFDQMHQFMLGSSITDSHYPGDMMYPYDEEYYQSDLPEQNEQYVQEHYYDNDDQAAAPSRPSPEFMIGGGGLYSPPRFGRGGRVPPRRFGDGGIGGLINPQRLGAGRGMAAMPTAAAPDPAAPDPAAPAEQANSGFSVTKPNDAFVPWGINTYLGGQEWAWDTAPDIANRYQTRMNPTLAEMDRKSDAIQRAAAVGYARAARSLNDPVLTLDFGPIQIPIYNNNTARTKADIITQGATSLDDLVQGQYGDYSDWADSSAALEQDANDIRREILSDIGSQTLGPYIASFWDLWANPNQAVIYDHNSDGGGSGNGGLLGGLSLSF